MAAAEKHAVLYCDTQKRRFVIEGGGPTPALRQFEDVAASLTVESVLAAAGLAAREVKFETTTSAAREFAAEVGKVEKDWSVWAEKELARFLDQESHKPLSKGRIPPQLEKPFDLVPDRLCPAIRAAIQAGALRETNGRVFLCPDPASFPGNSDRRQRAAEDNLRLLRGGWYEISVETALVRSGKFTDVRRSIAPGKTTALGETDLVAFDPARVRLIAVSCKADDEHLHSLEHLSELHDRTRRLGGLFARAALVIARSNDSSKLASVGTFAKALDIAVYVGNPIAGLPCLVGTGLNDLLYWGQGSDLG